MDYDTSGALTYLSDAEYYTKGPNSTPPTSGVAGIANESPLQLFPNPASEEVHIEFNSPIGQSIAVATTDMLGRVVGQNNNVTVAEGMNDVSYNVANLPPGVYLIKIQAADNVYLKKVQITR